MTYVDTKTVIKEVNISRTTLYRLTQQGLPYKVINSKKMYNIGEVKEFIEQRKNRLSQRLVIGQEYTNDEIVKIFNCSPQGGMRRSLTTNSLILFSTPGDVNRLYQDYWKEGILYYTGEGTKDNQTLSRNNKTLAESPENNVKVYLFERFNYRKKYRYRGIVIRDGDPFQDVEKDTNGKKRKVWKFKLKPVDESDSFDQNYFEKYKHEYQNKVKNMSEVKVIHLANDMNQIPSQRCVTTNVYIRNPVLSRYAKIRAKGKCELCGKDAPFMNHDGEPYLESHHLQPVSEGGHDTKDNICALCPNCHRKMHILNKREDLNKIRKRIERDEKDIENIL